MENKTNNILQGIYLNERELMLQTAKLTPKDIDISIQSSDRSNTKYICFYCKVIDGYGKMAELRISDHSLKNVKIRQFIVEPDKILDKQKMNEFKMAVENTIKVAKNKLFKFKMKIITKELTNKKQ